MIKVKNGFIYEGDNLKHLKELPDKSVDGICIDPPFNSGRNYTNFKDDPSEWRWNDQRQSELDDIHELYPQLGIIIELLSNGSRRSYLVFMARRLIELHRILNDHGSFFLICDDKELAYLEVLMDQIFSPQNKLNVINYRRATGKRGNRETISANRKLARCTGYILFYAKDYDKYDHDFKMEFRPLHKVEHKIKYPHFDGEKHYAQYTTFFSAAKEHDFLGLSRKWAHNNEKLMRLLTNKQLYYIDNKKHIVFKDEDHFRSMTCDNKDLPIYKKEYPMIINGIPHFGITDTWQDLKAEQTARNENGNNRGGKTEELMERVLKFITNPYDRPTVVLDAFLGFGTTAAIAEKLGYKWIGMEISQENIDITCERLNKPFQNSEDDFIYNGGSVQINLFDV